MAGQLIESMTGEWQPKKYRDSYTDRVNKLIRAKAKNQDYEPADEAPDATNVVDLVEALRASVDAAKGRRSTAKKSTARKSTAKKTATKKSAGARKSTAKRSPAKKTTRKSSAKKSA